MNNCLSVISLVFTLLFGGAALLQALLYNKNSAKLTRDMQYMMMQQLSLINDMQKYTIKHKDNIGKLDLSKDVIILHKMSLFHNKNTDAIMDKLNHLSIKRVFLENIRTFLEGKEIEYRCSFRGKAESDGIIDMREMYSILFEYGVIVIFDYKRG